MNVPEITEVQRLRLAPGDALVVRLAQSPSEADIHAIAERVKGELGSPFRVPVLVLGPNASIEVLSPPEV
jgi:hypothetical protein